MALLKPKEYFTSMSTTGGFVEPLIKAVLYGLVAGIFIFIWSLLNIGGAAGFGSMFGGAIGIMAFIWTVIGAVIGLFIGGVIVLIISAICGGSTEFEANVRVVASMMVLSPISALFGFLAGFSGLLSTLVSLVISLYGIWMLYHALNESLKAKPATSKIVSIILAALFALVVVIGSVTKKAASKSINRYQDMIEEMTTEEEAEEAEEAEEVEEAEEEEEMP